MKKIKITTPENIEVEYILANVASRTAAAVIDMLIQFGILLILGIALLLMWRYSPSFMEKYYGWIIGISILIFTLISYGYFVFMELSMNGQTLGKKVLKLRTIRNNGQPITLKHSSLRNLFRVFIDIIGIGIIFIFFSKDHKRLGDYVASTIVVIEESKSAPITLENLQNSNDNFNYYMSKEEQQLVRDYFERKDKMENYSEISKELRIYFIKKFEAIGVLQDFEGFINQL